MSRSLGQELAEFIQHRRASQIQIKSEMGVTYTLNNNHMPIVRSIIDGQGTIVTLAHKWLRYMSQQIGISVSEGTVEQYGRSLTYFIRWLEIEKPFLNLTIDESLLAVRRAELTSWIFYMRHSGVGGSTTNAREAAIKQFLDWLTTYEGGRLRKIEDSPWGKDDQSGSISKKPNKKSPKVITSDNIVELLSNLHNECERCMFHTQYDIGVRISELINFKQKDLPKESDYRPDIEFIPISISGVKGRAGNIKERITVISRPVLARIKRYHSSLEYRLSTEWDINDPEKPVFLTANGLSWSSRNASKQFKSAVERSNLSGSFVPHWMRHGTAFSILQSALGKDLYDKMLVVQQMLGHSNLTTTEIYTQIAPSLLINLSKQKDFLDRTLEAEYIRDSTYLAPLKHKEKRGHK